MSNIVKIAVVGVAIYAAYNYGKNKSFLPQKSLPKVDTDTLKTGSFSKEIENLQKNINEIVGRPVVEVTGAYSNEFKEIVNEIFKNTQILIDPAKGEVQKQKLHDLNKVLENLNNLISWLWIDFGEQ